MPEQKKAKASQDESCEFGPGALVMRDIGEVRLIAVGDLPPATLRRVIDSAQIGANEDSAMGAAMQQPAAN